MKHARSAGPTGARRRARPGRRRRPRARRPTTTPRASTGPRGGRRPRPRPRGPGSPGRRRARSGRPGPPARRTIRAPESTSTWRRNSPLYAVLIGTWIAPEERGGEERDHLLGPVLDQGRDAVAPHDAEPPPGAGQPRRGVGHAAGRPPVALEVEVRAVGIGGQPGREGVGDRPWRRSSSPAPVPAARAARATRD